MNLFDYLNKSIVAVVIYCPVCSCWLGIIFNTFPITQWDICIKLLIQQKTSSFILPMTALGLASWGEEKLEGKFEFNEINCRFPGGKLLKMSHHCCYLNNYMETKSDKSWWIDEKENLVKLLQAKKIQMNM